MFYKFTAYIVPASRKERQVVATGATCCSDFNAARLFARGFACGVHGVYLMSVYVAFHLAGSDHVSWVIYPAP